MGGVSPVWTTLNCHWGLDSPKAVTMPLFVAAVAVPVSASSDTQMGTNLLTGLFFQMLDEMKRRYRYKFVSHMMFNL